MSDQEKNNEWDSLWQEYTKSLENWKSLLSRFKMPVMRCNLDLMRFGKKPVLNQVMKP